MTAPKTILGAAALCCLCFAVALADEHELGAHMHGAGHLNLAIEGNAVEVELLLPGADVVGFEHAPGSESDKVEVEKAAAILKDGGALFAFPPEAGCRLAEAEIESAPVAGRHDDQAESEGEAHAEFHSRYRFLCDNPAALTHLDVRLFERFPSLQELETQTISPTGQSAHELTATDSRLSF